MNNNTGLTVWFTGLSGSGKTTLCRAVENLLKEQDLKVEVLDGDVIRKHLCRGLGFTKEDRNENVYRIAFVAGLLTKHGVIVLVAAIAPYRAARAEAAEKIGAFLEVFVDAPLEVCEQRDPKGLYALARSGALRGFTGLDDPYESPLRPAVTCRTDIESVEESAAKVLARILQVTRPDVP